MSFVTYLVNFWLGGCLTNNSLPSPTTLHRSYKHKNLLAYRGCYIDKADNSCKIISAPRGTGLKQILKSPNGISFEEKVKIVRDVAEALLFIQEMGLSYGQVTVDDIWVGLRRAFHPVPNKFL